MNKWLHLLGALVTGTASFTIGTDVHTIAGTAVAVVAAVQALAHVVALFAKKLETQANATTKK